MKGQDKSKKVAKLKSEIEEREKDLFYNDFWEQTGQIRADIETGSLSNVGATLI